jgi:hypothetical protein
VLPLIKLIRDKNARRNPNSAVKNPTRVTVLIGIKEISTNESTKT